MVRHLVWWTFKPEAMGRPAVENARIMKEQLEALVGKIPSLCSLEVSTKFLGSTTEDVELILMSTHEDEAGLKAYAEHPLHMAIATELVRPVVASRRAVDYYFD